MLAGASAPYSGSFFLPSQWCFAPPRRDVRHYRLNFGTCIKKSVFPHHTKMIAWIVVVRSPLGARWNSGSRALREIPTHEAKEELLFSGFVRTLRSECIRRQMDLGTDHGVSPSCERRPGRLRMGLTIWHRVPKQSEGGARDGFVSFGAIYRRYWSFFTGGA